MKNSKRHIKEYPIKDKQKVKHKEDIVINFDQNRIKTLIIIGVFFALIIAFVLISNCIENDNTDIPVVTQAALEVDTKAQDKGDNQDNGLSEQKESKKQPEYLQSYIDINCNTIGYIKIDGTKIDYPVVQTDNNAFYIDHNFQNSKDKYGAIFLDYRCYINDFSKTRNMIIYGHRMKDGSMFKDLLDYQDEEFFRENMIIRFDTLKGEYRWKVFSVFETTTDFYYIDTCFPYDEMWTSFLEECKSLSMHQSNINLYKDDIVLTLSTCSVDEDGRFVVMAKLLR